MYVCNCNGITESDVDEAIRAGAERWDDVHAYFDCAPRCGQCEREIACTLQQAGAAKPLAPRDGKRPQEAEPVFGLPALAMAG